MGVGKATGLQKRAARPMLASYLVWHLSFEIHGELQHVVVGFARK